MPRSTKMPAPKRLPPPVRKHKQVFDTEERKVRRVLSAMARPANEYELLTDEERTALAAHCEDEGAVGLDAPAAFADVWRAVERRRKRERLAAILPPVEVPVTDPAMEPAIDPVTPPKTSRKKKKTAAPDAAAEPAPTPEPPTA